jgi:hypothetical protein
MWCNGGDPNVGGRAIAMRADRTASGCDATGRTSCRPLRGFRPASWAIPRPLAWADVEPSLRDLGTVARLPPQRGSSMAAQANGLGRMEAHEAVPSPKVARLPPQSGNPMAAQANGLGRVDGRKSCPSPNGATRRLVAARSRCGPTGPQSPSFRVGTWCNGAIRTLVAARSRCGPTGPRRDVV